MGGRELCFVRARCPVSDYRDCPSREAIESRDGAQARMRDPAYIKWSTEYLARVSDKRLEELRALTAANVARLKAIGSRGVWIWSDRLARVEREIELRNE